MLRYPPSRVNLTIADIADYEQRLAARQSAWLSRPSTARVRLSPGPARQTNLSLVPAEQNVGRKRAASSSSEATLHDDFNDQPDKEPVSIIASRITSPGAIDASTKARQAWTHQAKLFDEAARALGDVIHRQQSPAHSSPRRQVDSFYGTEGFVETGNERHDRGQHNITLDGTNEAGTIPHRAGAQCAFVPSGSVNQDEIDLTSSARHAAELPQAQSQAFSSARARRRQARSQDVCNIHSSQDMREIFHIHNAHRVQISEHEMRELVPPVPQLILTPENAGHALNPALDPGAPVFVPRTRFGSATRSSGGNGRHHVAEPQWNSVDTTHTASDLRIRSSSEQNMSLPFRALHAPRVTVDRVSDINYQRSVAAVQSIHQRGSIVADQNTALPSFTQNFERYPLIRPPSSPRSDQHASDLLRPEGDQHQPALATLGQRPSLLQVRHASVTGADGTNSEHTRSVSPAFSSTSLSTPNLLQHPPYLGDSSLPWRRANSRTPTFHRVPSMVSAASGASGGESISRQSSREALDATAEFLRMRNSPLDDLTERFIRLSANRPRSVGRSWGRPPRPRVSLLSGNPFSPEPPSNRISQRVAKASASALAPNIADRGHVNSPDSADELVALSIALPPSSPLRTSPQAVPSTPPVRRAALSSLESSLPSQPSVIPQSPPESSIKRKPVPTVTATPKVIVYDDSKPPNTQPQTPADFSRLKRRAKTRSDTAIEQSPIFVGRVMISSPSQIPERHMHRNTYPFNTPSQNVTAGVVSNAVLSSGVREASRHHQSTRRTRIQRTSHQIENDLEGHIHGLEHDRRTWLGRREAGSLEDTPPREGRFEQYLS